ncbi:MAG: RsmE family RNA methyltransferase [Thermoleophilia bacterium]|nr:RsmE family RNA methyltransferase [Thermoleophilia bacterium]
MTAEARHRFRFFTRDVGLPRTRVRLTASDAAHLEVLRLTAGDAVEIVDVTGVVWLGEVADGGVAVLREPLPLSGMQLPRIDLIAGALVGGRFDDLVDGAVQAGVSSIAPFATSAKDARRLAERHDRLQRIATSAAKQAKRHEVPRISAPLDRAALLATAPGIVLDAAAHGPLDLVLQALDAARSDRGGALHGYTVLVGPAEGLSGELVAELVAAGWHAARLGPSILRAELAAAVAVAAVALHASH